MTAFQVKTNWKNLFEESPEVCNTSGFMQIFFNGKNITQNTNIESAETFDDALLSAYPLASWIAASWWRLLYETEPPKAKQGIYNSSWQIAHCLPFADYGFVWPPALFSSDGSDITAICYQHEPKKYEPIRYISEIFEKFTLKDFEKSLLNFLQETIHHLDTQNIKETDLHDTLRIIQDEYVAPGLKDKRILEACLGYNPDELPNATLDELIKIQRDFGKESVRSLLSQWAYEPHKKIHTLALRAREVSKAGISGKLDIPKINDVHELGKLPWICGKKNAQQLRKKIGLHSTEKVITSKLLDFFNMSESSFVYTPPMDIDYTLVSRKENSGVSVSFKKSKHIVSRRFSLARILGNEICQSHEENWIVANDSNLNTQKVQRAFAAEFLCPIEAILEYTDKDFSPKNIGKVAKHFQVSNFLVKSQLMNNNYIAKENMLSPFSSVNEFFSSEVPLYEYGLLSNYDID